MTEPSPANAVYYKKKEKHSNTKDDFKKNHEYEQKEREKKSSIAYLYHERTEPRECRRISCIIYLCIAKSLLNFPLFEFLT